MTLVEDYLAKIRRLLTEPLNPGQVDVVELEMRMIADDMTREERRAAIAEAEKLLQQDRDSSCPKETPLPSRSRYRRT